MMGEKREIRETMSIEEATVSNMWEIAAIVEVLERKGLCTKQDLLDVDRQVHRRLTEGPGALASCSAIINSLQSPNPQYATALRAPRTH